MTDCTDCTNEEISRLNCLYTATIIEANALRKERDAYKVRVDELLHDCDALRIVNEKYIAAIDYIAFYGKGDARRIAEEAMKEKNDPTNNRTSRCCAGCFE
jgi:hypothetical protein